MINISYKIGDIVRFNIINDHTHRRHRQYKIDDDMRALWKTIEEIDKKTLCNRLTSLH